MIPRIAAALVGIALAVLAWVAVMVLGAAVARVRALETAVGELRADIEAHEVAGADFDTLESLSRDLRAREALTDRAVERLVRALCLNAARTAVERDRCLAP